MPSKTAHHEEISRATFGSFDGATSAVGVLAGLLAAHATAITVLTTAGGLAVAAAVGMGFGDYLGGSSVRLAGVMAAATFVGSLLPALPVAFLPGPWAYLLGAVLIVALGVAIAELRAQEQGRLRAYALTGAVLLVASGLSAGAAVGLGAIG